jgi:septal ring factor EnvC (AmiA/AmiB activator)
MKTRVFSSGGNMENVGFNKGVIILSIALVVVVIGCIVFGLQMSSSISANKQDIATLIDQQASIQNSLSSADTNITALETKADTLTTDLQTQLSSINTQITNISNKLESTSTKESSDLSDLQNRVSNLEADINSLEDQLNNTNTVTSSLTSQVNSMNAQVSSLQNEIANINSQLETPVQLLTSGTITQAYGQESLVTTTNAVTDGHIYITGYSTSPTGYVYVTIDGGETSYYPFGTQSSTVVVPVQTGSIAIYFGNTATSGTVTAVFNSIIYYHY